MIEQDPLNDNEAIKKHIEDRSRRRRQREISDLKKILSFVEGRRFIRRLFTLSGVFQSAYAGNGQTDQTHFNLGYKQFATEILAEVRSNAPDMETRMEREYASDLASEKTLSGGSEK